MFDEAIWRHPSIILLDDLDHVVPAPTGPEAELSGEAIYGARIGEGMTPACTTCTSKWICLFCNHGVQ